MKLADKVDIQREKAIERKREIDEGAKLAHRVDVLRQTFAEEEAKLATFRVESLKHIQASIGNLEREQADLKRVVRALADERSMLKSLLSKEWKDSEADERLTEVASFRAALEERETALSHQELEIAEQLKEATLKASRINDEYIRVTDALKKADDARKAQEMLLQEAEAHTVAVNAFLTEKSTTLYAREAQIEALERDADNRELLFVKRAKALDDRERAVTDRYETLLRVETKYTQRITSNIHNNDSGSIPKKHS